MGAKLLHRIKRPKAAPCGAGFWGYPHTPQRPDTALWKNRTFSAPAHERALFSVSLDKIQIVKGP